MVLDGMRRSVVFFLLFFFLATALGDRAVAANGPTTGDRAAPSSVITELRVGESMKVGSTAQVAIRFRYPTEQLFDAGRNLEVVAQLSPSFRYRSGSAALTRPEAARELNPQEVVCEDGSSFVIFDLGPVELVDTNAAREKVQSEIRFEIVGKRVAPAATVSASASQQLVPSACGVPFPSQLSTSVGVLEP